MSKHLKDPLAWLHGLLSGIIGGAATAGSAWLGTLIAHSAGADIPLLNFKHLGIIVLSGGISSALAYLTKSPLPALESRDTETITKDQVTK